MYLEIEHDFRNDLIQHRRNIENSRDPKRPFEICDSATFGPDDPFTLLWLLELLRPFETDRDLGTWYRAVAPVATTKIDAVFKNPGDVGAALANKEAIEHVFPILRVVQLYKHLKNAGLYHGGFPSQLAQYLHNRLHLHLSYFSIPDSSYDAAELAFAMEALLTLDPNLLDSASVERCRRVLLESQDRNPYLRPLRPFIAKKQGLALLPLSVEIANSVLRSCEMLEMRDRSQEHISGNISLFRRYAEWLFTKKVLGCANSARDFAGWHSEHVDDPQKIHLWETSQVAVYLLHYEWFLRKHRASKSLTLMNLKTTPPPRKIQRPSELWGDLANPTKKGTMLRREPAVGLDRESDYAIFHRITKDYIEPRSGVAPVTTQHYSMLLYGPQGTGKTDLAENIARCLGQPLISISPSDFTVGGGALVEARAQAIFDVLCAQTDVVILLDEIDRLILDRDSEMYRKQGDLFQFMTPGMLTKFNNLRRLKRCIFIVSTNFAEHIDPAIKRAGRIDDLYVVLPPDTKQRKQIIRDQLEEDRCAVAISDDDLNEVARATVFLIPGELQRLAKRCLPRLSAASTTKDLVAELIRQSKMIEPTVRLSAYRARFRWGADNFQSNQEPYAEFLLLIYLLLESGKSMTTDEMGIGRECLDALKDKGPDLREQLRVYLKDETVVSMLVDEAGKFSSPS